mgnify:CR=1 FL=1
MNKVLFKNGQVFYHDQLQALDVLVEGDLIKAIEPSIEDQEASVIDLNGKLLSPGFIDIHTHLREPGFEYKETVLTGTKSALYGGYSTIVAMANTKPCMDDIETIERLENIIKKDACVHTYTYSAITTDLAGKELVDMEANKVNNIVVGFSDDGKGVQSHDMMEKAMKKVKEIDSIIVAHCEDESELKPGGCIHEGIYAKEHQLVGINNESEYKQVARDLDLVRQIHNRYHVCHVSTHQTVDLIRKAKQEGLSVSGEASPHHLVLTDENIKNCDPNYKMNPPLRSKEDREALIKGLNDGTLQVIATDHAPHSEEEKNQTIVKAPFGIIGLQHCFPLVYTYVVKTGETTLETVLKALTSGPAKVLHFTDCFEVGQKANLCVFDLNEKFVIKKEDLVSKASNTPFIGYPCYGKIKYNMIDGKLYQF